MKSIIVKNIMVQFDSFDDDVKKETVIDVLLMLNDELQQNFPDICPQIFVNAIDDDDIEIADVEEE